jgi:hypothetical protein
MYFSTEDKDGNQVRGPRRADGPPALHGTTSKVQYAVLVAQKSLLSGRGDSATQPLPHTRDTRFTCNTPLKRDRRVRVYKKYRGARPGPECSPWPPCGTLFGKEPRSLNYHRNVRKGRGLCCGLARGQSRTPLLATTNCHADPRDTRYPVPGTRATRRSRQHKPSPPRHDRTIIGRSEPFVVEVWLEQQ